jgi:hypothetical protein
LLEDNTLFTLHVFYNKALVVTSKYTKPNFPKQQTCNNNKGSIASMDVFGTMISSYKKYGQSQECKQFAIAPFKLLEFESLQTQKHILVIISTTHKK